MSTIPQPDSTAVATSKPKSRYWTGRADDDGTWRIDPKSRLSLEPSGEDLAALRSGLGRPAGTVPALWRFYTSPTDGEVTPELKAEHAALSLYGLHQQSQRRPMHRPGVSVGAALRALHHSGRFSEEAVERRVAAAVNSNSVSALLYRLRGLVTQLRLIEQPLDYDRLLRDIREWYHPESRRRVRRRWGLAYYAWGERANRESSTSGS